MAISCIICEIIIIIIIITDLYSAFRSEDTEALDAASYWSKIEKFLYATCI